MIWKDYLLACRSIRGQATSIIHIEHIHIVQGFNEIQESLYCLTLGRNMILLCSY